MSSLQALEDEFKARLTVITNSITRTELLEEAIGHYTIKLNNTSNPLTRSLFLCCLGDLMQEFDEKEESGMNQASLSYYEAACKECKYYGRPHAAIAKVLMENGNDTIGVLYHLAIAMNLRITNTSINDLKQAALSVLKRSTGRELDTRYLCAFICEKWIVVKEVYNNEQFGMLRDRMATIGALMVYYRLKTGNNLRQQDKDIPDKISVEGDVGKYIMDLIRNDRMGSDSYQKCLPFELDTLSNHETPQQLRTMKLMAQQNLSAQIKDLQTSQNQERNNPWYAIDIDVMMQEWFRIKERIKNGRLNLLVTLSLIRELDFRKKESNIAREIIRCIYEWTSEGNGIRNVKLQPATRNNESINQLGLQKHHLELIKYIIQDEGNVTVITKHEALIRVLRDLGKPFLTFLPDNN